MTATRRIGLVMLAAVVGLGLPARAQDPEAGPGEPEARVGGATGPESGPSRPSPTKPGTKRPARGQGGQGGRVRRYAGPPGRIVPFPMPPALIIRATPEVHGQVHRTLRGLRR